MPPCWYFGLGSDLLRIAAWRRKLSLDFVRRLLDLPMMSLEESLQGLNAILEEVEAISDLHRIGHPLARAVGVGSGPDPG
jgi:hypothetical protein